FSNIAFTTNDSSTNVEVSASTFEHSAFDLLGKVEAQNLDKYQWKNRLLVIKTNEVGLKHYTE
ncbi:hypothetical protein, partial [Flammeovirga pacifica]|uniref:hypothetical protein n=1 Tax=Flammeovirga pacifica TaxID=915059 RepID=UPI001301082D